LGHSVASRLARIITVAIALTVLDCLIAAQERPASPVKPIPEMQKLAELLEGDWQTTETMERSAEFPNRGSRQGRVHVSLAGRGESLHYEVHSDGSAGKLDGRLVISWEKDWATYGVWACFDPKHICHQRGTGHWEGDSFVNDYEQKTNGVKVRWRDTFNFSPTTYTLVAAMDTGNGHMKTQITTKATRAIEF